MRTTILFLVALVASLVALVLALPYLHSAPAPVTVQSQGPTIERLERLNQLVTTRVSVADVLVGEGEGCRGAWLIRSDALIAVNLGQARITARHENTKQATILLPQPEVLQPRVDHQRTRTWEVRRLAWMPWNADQDRLRDTVMLQAQQLVARAACSAENIQQAKIAAETILKTLYAEVGWEVQVTWEPKMAHVPTAAVPATMMSGNLVPAIELGAHRARVVPHEPTAFADGVPAKAKLSYQDRDRPGIRSPAITGDALRADSTCV